MFCSQCGTRLRASTRFCEECGAARRPDATIVQDAQGTTIVTAGDQDADLVPYQPGSGVVSPRDLRPPFAGQWGDPSAAARVVYLQPRPAHASGGLAAAPAMPSQAITFNPHINVSVAPPAPPPVVPAVPHTVVVVDSHDGFSLAVAALWTLGVGLSLGMAALIVAAVVSVHAEVALLFVLPLLFALFILAALALTRRRL